MVGVETLRGETGSGDGPGYGYGSGYGSGDGGYGSGDGGYGSGDGGYGSGSGAGSGDGYGDGSGSGDGPGYGDYWLGVMPSLMTDWTDLQRETFRLLVASKAHLAFWRSGDNGQPSNGGCSLETAAPGVIHRTKGPLNLCEAGTLHATRIPSKWQGERIWIVALHGEVIGDDEKFGCLEREIIGEWKR